tara:strand:+ start:1196 stop:1375 length:180 start_codon:yes stop_codon:yes gene_type:complete
MNSIRNKAKTYDSTFLFLCSKEMLSEARRIADESHCSLATLLRQSLKRQISVYNQSISK